MTLWSRWATVPPPPPPQSPTTPLQIITQCHFYQNVVLYLQKRQFITHLLTKYYQTEQYVRENMLDPYKLQQEASRPP